MTATPRTPKHRKSRRGFRLSSMESMGFIDRPSTSSTWSTRPPSVVPQVPPPPPVEPLPPGDPFADWKPSELGKKLATGNIHWSVLVWVALIAIGLVSVGFWLYQRPAAAENAALAQLNETASSLEPAIAALLDVDLASGDADVSTQMRTVDAAARDLFELSGSLPAALSAQRLKASDGAGRALEATRIVSDTLTYKSAVIPILAAPVFETDPSLIELDDAVLVFGTWQAKFMSIVDSLPEGTFDGVATELRFVSDDLDDVRAAYVDGLRIGNQTAAADAIDGLSGRLLEVETVLTEATNKRFELARLRLIEADEALVGLLG